MTTTNEEAIWPSLTAIFRDVFDDDNLAISPQTAAVDIEEWDSLTNIQLLVAIEQQFGIRFNSGEVANVRNVGELVALIVEHTDDS